MSIPDFQTVMRPVLEAIADGNTHSIAQVRQKVSDAFGLTEAERRQLLESGNQAVIDNRVGWARTYLKKAGLVSVPQRGMVQLTERGRAALTNGPERITVPWLKQFPEFAAFQNTKSSKKAVISADLPTSVEEEATPDELLASAHSSLMDALADELLRIIQKSTPVFFERLVVDLMIAMGYGGSRKEAGRATQATSDDGIDGTIKEDKLGLDVIYLQAKRWVNTVHRPEIDKFIGALTRQKARKGVFITTSDFSPGARESIRNLDMKVVLIDGQELAQLMIENNLGVNVKEVYEVKQIDGDYFVED